MHQARREWQWPMLAAALISGPVAAQENSVQVYGTLNVDVERVEAHGATVTVPARNRVTQNSSNLGFRGSEKLSERLAAFFQVESTVAVDSGGSNIASRNTGVGFKGDFGTAFVGQWDTPYKTISGAVDPMYFTGITYTGALIGTPGFGVGPVTAGSPATSGDGRTFANAANASFERRAGNSVQYWSPAFGGTNLRVAYSANENRTSSSPAVTHVNPYIWSASLDYQRGIFYAAYAHEMHADYFGLDALVPASQATPVASSLAASSRDHGDKLIARVKMGGTQVGLMGERLRFSRTGGIVAAGASNKYERDAYAVTLVQAVGAAGALRGLVGKTRSGSCGHFDGSACDTAGLAARQVSAGYSYSFSRRTDGYLFYTRVANDNRASYQFANAAGLGAAPGSTSVGYALGLRHTF